MLNQTSNGLGLLRIKVRAPNPKRKGPLILMGKCKSLSDQLEPRSSRLLYLTLSTLF
jgi:hypothetical protein